MKKIEDKELWSSLNERSRAIETGMDALARKRTGSYYTDIKLTDIMMEELVSQLRDKSKPLYEYRFLEPCVGAGNFVFSYIKAIHNTSITKEEAAKLLENIYVADVNKEALSGYIESIKHIASEYWNIELEDEYFKTHLGTGLLVDVTKPELEYIGIRDVFSPEIVKDGFDIVATNPPYKNLKAEKSHYNSSTEYDMDKSKYTAISQIVSNQFKYSTSGVLNLYKLFVEEIIDQYANETAYVSLLIPASIMSDKTCMKLRSHILKDSRLLTVKVICEGSGYIGAQQALSAMLIEKGKKTEAVKVTKDFCNAQDDIATVSIEDILNENTGNAIIAVNAEEYRVLKQLRKYPVVKDLDFIINLRGELDLTANKRHITNVDTGFPLIRGRNISYYELQDIETKEYVTDEFISKTKKKCYIERDRIICQQIANMNKERRVTFAYMPANYVLGNSCNFVSVNENKYNIDIYAILGLFNTSIINWLFKLTSSNNHVNNYEIDAFPVPVESPQLPRISMLVQEYLKNEREEILDEIELLAKKAYGVVELDDDEKLMSEEKYVLEYFNAIRYILPGVSLVDAKNIILGKTKIESYLNNFEKFEKNVALGITKKYKTLYDGYLLNHTTFKLSDLDLEMIKNVPQGGSWKDIPMETVVKSKRLKRITETGGRTTLYGRIDYEKPSYTITTYFNRPGNGTYVHPMHERVLTVREAARFQSFLDDYYFFGNKTQHLKQVGNAVPTVLAYQIGKKIKDVTGCSKSIDLFCGAGGMTAGFKAAGIHSLLSNDIEESACTTLKINNPEINVFCGDITDENTKSVIEQAAIAGNADIICGGPPCQGFSLAGFRADDDPRNQLFREFVDIVKRVNPKVIVFENVEGLLSYQDGKTYREVHALFSELGYNTEGRTLLASEYGVPQKRKRVIIICTRNDLGISPDLLYPEPITKDEKTQITARDTISDLENVECGEESKYSDVDESVILKLFKGKITYKEYVDLVKSSLQEEMNTDLNFKYRQLTFEGLF